MKEKPILFSAEMVRAILDGRKTQTRRVIKPKKHAFGDYSGINWKARPNIAHLHCPYGEPGDLLWVRETWRPYAWHEGEPIVVELKADGAKHECYTDDPALEQKWIEWEENIWISISDELNQKGIKPDENGMYDGKAQKALRWRPSIFMPRWASRITLRVVNVRVERLQDISNDDAKAEGVNGWAGIGAGPFYRGEFEILWDKINARRGYSWNSNPWVWVIEFEEIDT